MLQPAVGCLENCDSFPERFDPGVALLDRASGTESASEGPGSSELARPHDSGFDHLACPPRATDPRKSRRQDHAPGLERGIDVSALLKPRTFLNQDLDAVRHPPGCQR